MKAHEQFFLSVVPWSFVLSIRGTFKPLDRGSIILGLENVPVGTVGVKSAMNRSECSVPTESYVWDGQKRHESNDGVLAATLGRISAAFYKALAPKKVCTGLPQMFAHEVLTVYFGFFSTTRALVLNDGKSVRLQLKVHL